MLNWFGNLKEATTAFPVQSQMNIKSQCTLKKNCLDPFEHSNVFMAKTKQHNFWWRQNIMKDLPHIWVVFFFYCGALSFCWCLRGGYGLPTRPQWEPTRAQVVGNLPTRPTPVWFCLRRCLRGYSPGSFSPPVRWGLLRFYVSCLLLRLLFFSSSSSNCDDVSSVSLAGPQPRSCEHSVPCRTSTAIVWVQRSGPQPRSCVAQCASGDASWRGSVYWKTSWGERAPRL